MKYVSETSSLFKELSMKSLITFLSLLSIFSTATSYAETPDPFSTATIQGTSISALANNNASVSAEIKGPFAEYLYSFLKNGTAKIENHQNREYVSGRNILCINDKTDGIACEISIDQDGNAYPEANLPPGYNPAQPLAR
jgi:hypothetical protein